MRFASDISIWWLIPWAGICVFLAIWFYRNVNWLTSLSKKWQMTLKVLRGFTLFLLGVLLCGILFEAVDYREEKPIIITLVDESSSMKNYKDSSKINGYLTNLQNDLKEQLGEEFEFVEMTVGSDVEYKSKPDFKDGLSDLSAGFDKINSDFYNRNIGGIIFVSDGNYNKGNNPTYAAEKINFTPVFALTVGDTIPKRDHFIKNVLVNDVTFYKNKFPVEIDIEAIKMGKGGATVSISSEGKTVATQKVNYKDGKHDFEHLSFLLDATKIGFQTYTVTVSNATNEYNYKNNSRVFYIEVIDSRSKVLMLAGAPHPDVSAMKQLIEEDENLEVVSELTKDWKRDLKKVDLIIWHEPGVNFDPSLNSLLAESKIPILYIIGPNTSSGVISKLGLGMTVSPGNQSDEIQGGVNDGFQQFELSDELKNAFAYYPPLRSRFGELKVSGGAEVLVYQRIGPIKKKEPLIFFNKKGIVKNGVIYGEGLWKWKINDYTRTGDCVAFRDLINKTTQYLLVKQNTTALHVTFPKRFSKDEEVVVNASFYNESLEAITTPKINLVLTNEKGKTTKSQFGVTGDSYKLSLGKLKPGKYNWVATTAFNGKSYKKSGVFVVEDIALEQLDTYANQALMNQLAQKTKGKFELLKNYQKVIDQIKNRDDITSVSIKDASFNDLIDYKLIALLLLLSLAIEWFLRRWFGGY
jgi:hypothetical protein